MHLILNEKFPLFPVRDLSHVLCSVIQISQIKIFYCSFGYMCAKSYPQTIITQNKFLQKLRIIIVSTLTVTGLFSYFTK